MKQLLILSTCLVTCNLFASEEQAPLTRQQGQEVLRNISSLALALCESMSMFEPEESFLRHHVSAPMGIWRDLRDVAYALGAPTIEWVYYPEYMSTSNSRDTIANGFKNIAKLAGYIANTLMSQTYREFEWNRVWVMYEHLVQEARWLRQDSQT